MNDVYLIEWKKSWMSTLIMYPAFEWASTNCFIPFDGHVPYDVSNGIAD